MVKDQKRQFQASVWKAYKVKNQKQLRPSWDTYFLRIAELVATRATCDRKHVGAVIVRDKRIIATGYNGSPRGLPHCDEAGHELKQIEGRDSCVRTLHAESNALDQAGREAQSGELYVTVIPCYDCAKRIVNANVWKVVYGEYYASRNTELVESYLQESGVQLERLELPKDHDLEDLRKRRKKALDALFALRDHYHELAVMAGRQDRSLENLIVQLNEVLFIMNGIHA